MTVQRRLLPLSAAAVGVALMGFSVNGMANLEHDLQLAAAQPPQQAGTSAYSDDDCPRLKNRETASSRL